MAIDTPARIAILGAGPIGLEAALYARFLGYDVDIYERECVAANVLKWGHVRMFTPFGLNRSPLGLAALAAHDPSYQPPADAELLTGREWVQRYLLPLSQTDLLADHLRLGAHVVAVGKDEILKGDLPGHEDRGDWNFRLLVRDSAGHETIERADAVLDTTGVYGNPNWLGQGGIPAVGESALREGIEYGLPDVLEAERSKYAGHHTLVVGAGHCAATTVVNLADLAIDAPHTRLTWITRKESVEGRGPVPEIPHDPLLERSRISQAANHLAATDGSCVVLRAGVFVDQIRRDAAGGFEVLLSGQLEGEHRFDHIVANVGYRPDNSLYRELQIQECSATTRAAAPSEPNYYILGAKSYGRISNFLFADGLNQIREIFAIIGDRANLDLYATAPKLV